MKSNSVKIGLLIVTLIIVFIFYVANPKYFISEYWLQRKLNNSHCLGIKKKNKDVDKILTYSYLSTIGINYEVEINNIGQIFISTNLVGINSDDKIIQAKGNTDELNKLINSFQSNFQKSRNYYVDGSFGVDMKLFKLSDKKLNTEIKIEFVNHRINNDKLLEIKNKLNKLASLGISGCKN